MFLRAAVLISLASPAAAFVAGNDLTVRPTGPGQFTVPYQGKPGPTDFWCAAGDYVIRSLGQPPQTRIYRTSAPPRRSGQGMDFSLSASPEQAKTGLIVLGEDDRSLSALLAQSFCSVMDDPSP